MSKYLLTCQCGKTVPVDVGQAGGRVTCECGTSLEVPTLRNLRHLPVDRPAPEKAAGPEWSSRKGVVAFALIVACLCAIGAAWNWYRQPEVPVFNPERQRIVISEELAKLTPAQAWQHWVERYRPMGQTGFAVLEYPYKAAIESQIAESKYLQKLLLITAAIFAALAAAVAFWPSSPQRRSR